MMAIRKSLAWISNALLFVACFLTVAMMVQVSADVFSRYVFNRPLVGTLEWVTYIYMVACVFLPLAIVQRNRAQITVEIFSQAIPPRFLAGLDALMALMGCAFVALLAYRSSIQAWAQTMIGETTAAEAMKIHIWPARWFVVIGMISVAIYMLIQAFDDFYFSCTGRKAQGSELSDRRSAMPAGDVL